MNLPFQLTTFPNEEGYDELVLGTLRTDPGSRAEFFALARVPTSPGPV